MALWEHMLDQFTFHDDAAQTQAVQALVVADFQSAQPTFAAPTVNADGLG